ncbi:MAG: HutD family protein [Pseudomonadota bacterium]|jgi:uncharacterized protein
MQRLWSAEHRRMRWKNGKGETVEIAVHPPGAALDAFAWRVSTAAVVEDGPFSCFDGVDRTLAVLAGGTLRLQIGAAPACQLDPTSDPLAFAADAPCHAQLFGGVVADLNIMSRRGLWQHRLQRLACAVPIAQASVMAVLVAAPGPATVRVDGVTLDLGPLDALRLEAGQTVTLLDGDGWLAQFDPSSA